MRPALAGISIGTILIIVGIALSVGANSGLIKQTSTTTTNLSEDDTFPKLLAELELGTGDSVAIKLSEWGHSTTDFVLTLYVKDASDVTVKTQEFVADYEEGTTFGGWEPDLRTHNPWPLFTAQESSIYSFYMSLYRPVGELRDVTFEASCQVIVTSPPPYDLVLILGLTVTAVGAVVVVGSFLLEMKKRV